MHLILHSENAAVSDIGVYCIHSLVRLFGTPKNIHSMSSSLENNFECSGIVLMEYPDMIAEAIYSKVTVFLSSERHSRRKRFYPDRLHKSSDTNRTQTAGRLSWSDQRWNQRNTALFTCKQQYDLWNKKFSFTCWKQWNRARIPTIFAWYDPHYRSCTCFTYFRTLKNRSIYSTKNKSIYSSHLELNFNTTN